MLCIGVDVGGTNLVAGLVDETGCILSRVAQTVDRSLSGRELCYEIVELCRQVCAANGAEQGRITAVGIGFPGLVDHAAGSVIHTPNLPFRHIPVRAIFQTQWDVPIYLGNDANCAALGEYWAGAAKGYSSAMIITIGTGIGGGMVTNGRLFTGCAGGAMEIGHMITHPGGVPCGCGSRGCWERYASATALIGMTQARLQADKAGLLWALCKGDVDKVKGYTPFQAARLGDKGAQQVLERYLLEVSAGIIGLVNVLQPQIICLGGGISNAEDDLLLEPLQALVSDGVFDKSCAVRLTRAALGNDAGVVGAALLCKAL